MKTDAELRELVQSTKPKTQVSPRQEAFLQELVVNKKSQTQAYKAAYDGVDDKSAGEGASQMLSKNFKVKARKKELEQTVAEYAKKHAQSAIQTIREIMDDKHTNVGERRKAAGDLLRYAGEEPAQKVHSRNEEVTLPGLTDKQGRVELLRMALEDAEQEE